jgi:hypothetical protein
VSGPLESLDDLNAAERLLRAALLHDAITMEITPLPDLGTAEPMDSESTLRLRISVAAIWPDLTGYEFITEQSHGPSRDVDLSPKLLELAGRRNEARSSERLAEEKTGRGDSSVSGGTDTHRIDPAHSGSTPGTASSGRPGGMRPKRARGLKLIHLKLGFRVAGVSR